MLADSFWLPLAGVIAAWVGAGLAFWKAWAARNHAETAKSHMTTAQEAAVAAQRSAAALEQIAAVAKAERMSQISPILDYDSRNSTDLEIKIKGGAPFEVESVTFQGKPPLALNRVLKPLSMDPHQTNILVPVPEDLVKACAQGKIEVVSGRVSLSAEGRAFESHFRWNMKGASQERILPRDSS